MSAACQTSDFVSRFCRYCYSSAGDAALHGFRGGSLLDRSWLGIQNGMDSSGGRRRTPEGHRLSVASPVGFMDCLRDRGNHRAGLALAQTFAHLAEERRDPEGLLVGERLVGISRHFLGEQDVA